MKDISSSRNVDIKLSAVMAFSYAQFSEMALVYSQFMCCTSICLPHAIIKIDSFVLVVRESPTPNKTKQTTISHNKKNNKQFALGLENILIPQALSCIDGWIPYKEIANVESTQ